MGVGRAHGEDPLTAIEQREPVLEEQHGLGLRRAGVDQLHGVEGILRVGSTLAGSGEVVQLDDPEGPLLVGRPAGVIENHRQRTLGAHVGDRGDDIPQVEHGYGVRGVEGEGVEVPDGRRHLVAHHRREVLVEPHALLVGLVVGVVVVVGRDGQLDTFAGQGDHALLDIRVTMAAEGQGVDVGISGNPAARVDLVLEGELQQGGFGVESLLSQVQELVVHRPLRSAGCDHLVVARGHLEARLSGRAVDHARSGRLLQVGGRVVDGDALALHVQDRDPRGNRLPTPPVGHPHPHRSQVEHLAEGGLDQAHASKGDVVRGLIRAQLEAVAAVQEGARRKRLKDLDQLLGRIEDDHLLAVHVDRPAVVDVALGVDQRPLLGVGLGLELEVQAGALGARRRLGPLGGLVVAQVVHVRVEHELGGVLLREGRGQGQATEEQGEEGAAAGLHGGRIEPDASPTRPSSGVLRGLRRLFEDPPVAGRLLQLSPTLAPLDEQLQGAAHVGVGLLGAS